MSTQSPTVLLQLARGAAYAAGQVLLDSRWAALEVGTKSSDTDPVSSADTAAQRAIARIIEAARPSDGLIGEEENLRKAGTSGVQWVIDPLDGTVNYLYGRDEWAVSIAARYPSGSLAAVVYAPALHRCYTAIRGAGAWLEHLAPGGRPTAPGGATARPDTATDRLVARGARQLAVRPTADLAVSIVGTGFSYAAEGRRVQAATLAGLLPRVADIRRSGSAALDLASVASGELDAFYEDDLQEWDWAAGALIAAESGAVVEPLPGPGGRSGILAATPAIYRSLATSLNGHSG